MSVQHLSHVNLKPACPYCIEAVYVGVSFDTEINRGIIYCASAQAAVYQYCLYLCFIKAGV